MPQERRPALTPPVVFDDTAWAEDLLRASATARRVATEARGEFETKGVPIAQLKACEPEGPAGTRLPHCVKVYLPAPDGPHGMVFEIERINGRLRLLYVAFGLRHPGPEVRQPSVYEVAHRRLNR
jgi:hypothetical protein